MSEVEDTVIVLDVSRSMGRKDLAPSRLVAAKGALVKYINKKLDLSSQSQVGIVSFGERATKALFLTSDRNVISDILHGLEMQGNISYIGAAIAMGIQMHVDMLRQISGRISRMLVISDGRYSKDTAMDPLNMAKLAQGLGIHIDCINVGVPDESNLLQEISSLTGGQYLQISDYGILSNALTSLANMLSEDVREYLKSKKPLLSDLAGELVSISDMSDSQRALVDRMTKSDREKCLICYQSDCAVCKQVFFSCGRYCPNCGSPMHLHCASQWAAADTKTDSNVFRCPHCFYLLKVPATIQKVHDLRDRLKAQREYLAKGSKAQDVTDAESTGPVRDLVNKVTPEEIGDAILTATCPVCDSIFEDDEDFLYECSNLECNALYHPACFNKLEMVDGNRVCRKCSHVLVSFD